MGDAAEDELAGGEMREHDEAEAQNCDVCHGQGREAFVACLYEQLAAHGLLASNDVRWDGAWSDVQRAFRISVDTAFIGHTERLIDRTELDEASPLLEACRKARGDYTGKEVVQMILATHPPDCACGKHEHDGTAAQKQHIETAAMAIYEAGAFNHRPRTAWNEDAPGHLEFDREQYRIMARAVIEKLGLKIEYKYLEESRAGFTPGDTGPPIAIRLMSDWQQAQI